jgi:hypothetical protein
MTTLATHNPQAGTTGETLFVAFELSEKTWKLGLTTGPGHKPRERTVSARQQERVLDEIARATDRLGLPASAAVVVAMKQAAQASGCIGVCRGTGSRIMWWIPPLLRSTVASVGRRVMDWTCASC